MSGPLIGVTAGHTTSKSGAQFVSVADAYLKALSHAGACPVIIPLGLAESTLLELTDHLDGVLFTGGGDIQPSIYGEQSGPEVSEIDPDRDRIEFLLLNNVIDNGVPFLGICRGLQVINVGLGGTLYADISSQRPGALKHDFYPDWPRDHLAHDVQIEENSRLARILGEAYPMINSLHHQAVRRLAPGVLATAYSPDGLVEALEVDGHPFALAVQWHPEWLVEYAQMRALFRAFVEAAERRRET